MIARIIFFTVFLMSFNLFAGQVTSDVTCSFQGSVSSIVFEKLIAGHKAGTSPQKKALFTIGGKKIPKKSVADLAIGRSSWVESDLKDDRPAATIDFKNEDNENRLAIYYCSGDGKTVDAKLFAGKIKKQKDSSFESTQVIEGSCSGSQLREVFTTDCSVFK